MKIISKIILSFILVTTTITSFATENIFYILRQTRENQGIKNLEQHGGAINILILQAYHINAKGEVAGKLDPGTLAVATQKNIKVMALVTNAGFNKISTASFLNNQEAQKIAIQKLLVACKQNNLYGVQFDFELVPVSERAALTKFYLNAARAFHAASLKVSFAVIPLLSDQPFTTAFQKRSYENLSGVYDLKKLGKCADFVTIMAYNQHTAGTTPGPIASAQWVESAIKYSLRFIPRQKISLGIPVYSGYWFTGPTKSGKITTQMTEISYADIQTLIKKHHSKLLWHTQAKVNYSIFERGWLNEYLFIENAKSFQQKLNIAKKYKLRGISVFTLGIEDPNIWKDLA